MTIYEETPHMEQWLATRGEHLTLTSAPQYIVLHLSNMESDHTTHPFLFHLRFDLTTSECLLLARDLLTLVASSASHSSIPPTEMQTTQSSSEDELKSRADSFLVDVLAHVFAIVTAQQRKQQVLLPDLAKTLKDYYPLLRPKDYGHDSHLFLIKSRTDLFVFQPTEINGTLLDLVSWRADAPYPLERQSPVGSILTHE